jgi:hypothetical protein
LKPSPPPGGGFVHLSRQLRAWWLVYVKSMTYDMQHIVNKPRNTNPEPLHDFLTQASEK